MAKGEKTKILIGLKKAQSSLERIIKIMETDKDGKNEKCFSVIQQNLSVIGLLKSVNLAMLENHIDIHIANLRKGKMNRKKMERMKEEILKTIKQAQK